MNAHIYLLITVFVSVYVEAKTNRAQWKGLKDRMSSSNQGQGKQNINSAEFRAKLNIKQNEDFKKIRSEKSPTGKSLTSNKFIQSYCGNDVLGGQVTTVTDAYDNVVSAVGTMVDFSEAPSCDGFLAEITQGYAIEKAVSHHKTKSNLPSACDPKAEYLGTFIIDISMFNRQQEPTLKGVYRIQTNVFGMLCLGQKSSAYIHFIDIISGEIIHSMSAINEAKGNDKSKAKGKKKKNKKPNLNKIVLKGGNKKKAFTFCNKKYCDFKALDVNVQFANETMSVCDINTRYLFLNKITTGLYYNEFNFDCYEHVKNSNEMLAGDETNDGFSPITDVAFCGQATYKMYKRLDVGGQAAIFPMYAITNLDEPNAFFIFFEGVRYSVYGNGFYGSYPFTSCEIVAHEFAHAYTQYYSGLVYEGESGGLNEAYSDVAGFAIKDDLYSVRDFLIGDMVMRDEDAFFRNACDPTADGYSIDHYDDYFDGLDVHFSSGIINKMVCILYTSQTFTIRELLQMFSVANRDFWTPTSTFHEAVCGLLQAEMYLFDEQFRSDAIVAAAEQVGLKCPDTMQY